MHCRYLEYVGNKIHRMIGADCSIGWKDDNSIYMNVYLTINVNGNIVRTGEWFLVRNRQDIKTFFDVYVD